MGAIRIERDEKAHVARLVIEGVGPNNAITMGLAQDLSAALAALEHDDAIKVIVIAGAGADLSCGVDASEIRDRFALREDAARPALVSQRQRFQDADLWWGRDGLFGRILYCPKVTLVAARGQCFGVGMYLALFADLTIAAPDARFAMPQWRHVGVNGDISMLVAAIGLKRAKEFIYCDASWDAATALTYGLVDKVSAAGAHEQDIAALAQSCAMIMRDAVAAEKQVVRAALARMQIETGFAAAAVIAGWGSNIHFRAGEFNLLREAKHAGLEAVLARARERSLDDSA